MNAHVLEMRLSLKEARRPNVPVRKEKRGENNEARYFELLVRPDRYAGDLDVEDHADET